MELNLKNLLKLEVARKGRNSTISFALFSIFTYFYGFGLERNLNLIRTVSVIIFFISITRYFLNLKIEKNSSINDQDWIILRLLIWLNALGWSIILNVASFELKLSGNHFIVVTTLLAGLIGASILPLSYFKSLFLPFQAMLLLPQIFIVIYFYFSPEKINYLPMILLYLMYFVFQLKQYRDQHRDIVKLLRYQISLVRKNIALKKSQDALIDQTVKLVHTSRLGALGEMSASIAHEINNPITLIGTSSKIILRDLEKLDNEVLIKDNIVKNIERINKSVNRVGRIVKGLRTFSNQADNQPKEIISLKEIIEETCFFCSELLISKHVSLNIDEIPEISIECHSVQISQVLINLIKNAAEVLVEDPCLDERWIKISFEHSKSLLKIIIINGGKKINPQIVSKLFGPFFTTKAVGVGTGLGLSISKNIMNDHNGDLEVDLNYDHTAFLMSFNL